MRLGGADSQLTRQLRPLHNGLRVEPCQGISNFEKSRSYFLHQNLERAETRTSIAKDIYDLYGKDNLTLLPLTPWTTKQKIGLFLVVVSSPNESG